MHPIISEDRITQFASAVRRAMAEKGWIRKQLADAASVSDGVVGKILAGKPVHNNTVIKVARVLGIDIDRSALPPPSLETNRSDEDHGAYLRSEVEGLIGQYVGYRRTFDEGRELFRTIFEFSWSDENARLQFIETQRIRRLDKTIANSHAGGIHLSRRFGLIQLLTRFQGAIRLVTLHPPEVGETDLRGVVLTQAERRAKFGPTSFAPGVSPLFLRRASPPIANTQVDSICGVVPKTDPDFDDATRELQTIATHYLALPLE